ncbi:11596_t:CDS:1, partial [Acaulospora colombiana]
KLLRTGIEYTGNHEAWVIRKYLEALKPYGYIYNELQGEQIKRQYKGEHMTLQEMMNYAALLETTFKQRGLEEDFDNLKISRGFGNRRRP